MNPIPGLLLMQNRGRFVFRVEMEKVNQIAVSGMVWPDHDRSPAAGHGFIEPALVFQDDRQICMGLGEERVDFERLPVMLRGAVEIARVAQNISEAAMRLEQAGLQGNRP